MSYLLEILGRGLLAELSAAFHDLLHDDGHHSTEELLHAFEGTTRHPQAAISYGTRCLANRDNVSARKAFEAARMIEPDNLAAAVGLACVCDEVGHIEDAVEHLHAVRPNYPDEPALLFALGFCHERIGKTDQAVADYRSCLEAAPNLRNAHERLAAIYLKQNELDPAIEEYEQICWYEPSEPVPALTLANLYLQAGRGDEAIRRYQMVLTLDPDSPLAREARDDLVSAYEESAEGGLDKAIELLRKIIAEQPDYADNHLRLGDLYSKLGLEDRALAEYEAAAEMSPDYLEAVVKVGTSHLRRRRNLEAAEWFSRAVEINDRLLTACVGLGIAQHEMGHTDEAMASFEMASSVEPNSTLLFSETARLHLKMSVQRQVDEYLSPLRIVRDADGPPSRGIHPGTEPRPSGSGPVADLIERQIQRHRHVLKKRPNYADLHYRLGLLLKHRGLLDEAVDSFRRATAINPNSAKALIQLGLSLHEQGRSDDAIPALSQALEVEPESLELHYQLGLMFADRHQFAQAVEQFELGLEKEPRNIDFHANLALALQNMGLIDRAKAAWQTLCDVAESADGGPAGAESALGGLRRDNTA